MLWQGPTAYTKTVRHEDLQGGGKGSRTTDPKSRCLKAYKWKYSVGLVASACWTHVNFN